MPVSLKKASFKEPEEAHQVSFLKRNEFYVSAAILIASLLYYLSYASYGFNEGDWGLIAVASEQFLQGKAFYRDISIMYTPGIYLYTALFFKLFGISLHSATVAWSIIRAFNCLLIYRLGIKLISRRFALLLPLILWLASGTLQKSFFVFFILVNILILLRLLSTNSKGFYFFSGIIAGISFIFRIDLFGTFVITVLLVEFLKSIESVKNGSIMSQIAGSLKNLSFFSGGTIIAILPFALYLFSNAAMDNFLSQVLLGVDTARPAWFLWRPLVTQIFSWTKWDFVYYAILFIPVVIYSLLLAVLVSDIIARKFTEKDRKLSIILLYGGMIAMNQIINGPGLARLFLSSPPILIADMYLISRFYLNRESSHKKFRLINTVPLSVVTFMFLSLIIASCFTRDMLTNSSIFVRFTNTTHLSIPPRVNVHTYKAMAEDVSRIINIIEATTEKDGYIFTIPHLAMYYFATGHKNGTRYYYMPQYEYSDEKQLELIKDLEDNKVKLIIFRPTHRSHVPVVFEYINEHYRIKEKIGDKIIYVRKDPA